MQKTGVGRALRVFTPFMILLAGLAVLNYQVANESSLQANPTAAPTPLSTKPSEVADAAGTPVISGQPPIATAIRNGSPATPEPSVPPPSPTPTPPPEDAAVLLGPPVDSSFSVDSPVTFYWQSDKRLEEDQLFVLHIFSEAGEQAASVISASELGSGYQAGFVADSLDLPPGDYLWQVRLLGQPAGPLLAVSEQRPITFVDKGN